MDRFHLAEFHSMAQDPASGAGVRHVLPFEMEEMTQCFCSQRYPVSERATAILARRFAKYSYHEQAGKRIAQSLPTTLIRNRLFGDILDLGPKTAFPAATPDRLKSGQQGVFYQELARTYVVHLNRETTFLLTGSTLANRLAEQLFARDADGSYWLALYQRCVHLGTTVTFLDRCASFKCPSHGAQYNCDGAYLDGPAPRSMDRFPLSFKNDHLFIDTGRIIQTPHPDNATQRLIAIPQISCFAY